eukprot:scaffold7542_cov124-Isochrysis_galbana.AAC.4
MGQAEREQRREGMQPSSRPVQHSGPHWRTRWAHGEWRAAYHLPPLDAGCAVIRVPVFDGRVARLGVLLDAREQALHLGAPIH